MHDPLQLWEDGFHLLVDKGDEEGIAAFGWSGMARMVRPHAHRGMLSRMLVVCSVRMLVVCSVRMLGSYEKASRAP